MIADRSLGRLAWVIAGILGITLTVSGCRLDVATTSSILTKARAQGIPYALYTHCGINELSIGGKYFQRVGGSLTDGSGNPPMGWGNPYQRGTLRLVGDIAVFHDEVGHIETFKIRSESAGPLMICS